MPLQRTSPYHRTSPRHRPKDTADASASSSAKKEQTSQAIFNQKSLQASPAHLKKTATLNKDVQQSPPANHRKRKHDIASHDPEPLRLEKRNRTILKNIASPEEAKALLFDSASKGDLRLIQDLIQEGADLSGKNHAYKDAALVAYEAKHFECASALLYANIERSDSPDRLYAYYAFHKCLPIFHAIKQKHQDLLNLCIKVYASQLHTYRNKGISENRDSVLMAMIRYHLDIENPHLLTEEMLKAQNDQGDTALMLAIETKNPDIYNTILKYSSDVSAQNNQRSHALHFAIFNLNDFELIQALLDKGIDPTVESEIYGNALHASIQKPNLALVERFAHWENMRTITPELLIALCSHAITIGEEYFAIFSYLWKHTQIASLNYSALSEFTHPLILLGRTIHPTTKNVDMLVRQMDLMDMILNTPNIPLNNPKILETYIQYNFKVYNIQMLLKRGFPLCYTPPDPQPPYLIQTLHQNRWDTFLEILNHAQKQGIHIVIVDHTNDNNETALMVSISLETTNPPPISYTKKLLEHKANIHIQRSTDRNSAMMLALKSNRLEAFHLLFEHTISKDYWITQRNSDEEDLFMIAFSNKQYEIARKILLHLLEMPDELKSELFNFYGTRQLSPLFLATELEDPQLFDACLPFCSNLHLLKNKINANNNLLIELILSELPIPSDLLSLPLISKQNKWNQTALTYAILKRKDDLICQFEALGFNFIEEKKNGNAFTLAATFHHLDLIKKFASMDGMNLHATDAYGRTVLRYALTRFSSR